MSELRTLLTTRGMTDAQVRLMNWTVLAIVVVAVLLRLFFGFEGPIRMVFGSTVGTYALILLLLPEILKLRDPALPIEKHGAWLVGVAGYGGLFLGFQLCRLFPLFG